MPRFFIAISLIAGAVVICSSASVAGAEQEPRYDPKTVINTTAVVQAVRDVDPPNALAGRHVIAKTEKQQNFDVYLAPLDYLKDFELRLNRGDEIHVIGSRVKSSGMDLILAREVRTGDTTIYLRDEAGQPYWTEKSRSTSD